MIGLIVIALGAAAFAVWFQWRQTRRCLAFYGPDVARAIQQAPRVELWRLAVAPPPRGIVAASRVDVSHAPGIVHLRHGLVEDANFTWEPHGSARVDAAAWDGAIAFFGPDSEQPEAILAFGLHGAPSLTVVGQGGRIGLGRFGKALDRWLTATGMPVGR